MKINNKKMVVFSLSFLAVMLLASVDARADSNALEIVFCNALALVTGTTGRTLAAIAVIATGAGFFLGKINWSTMIAVALGIATLFGAPTIVSAIAGGDSDPCDGVATSISE